MENFQGQDGFVWFTGVVEDRNDPTKLGRVRVRCVGYHTDDKVKIPTEDLPWAWVLQTIHTPSMNGMGHTPGFLVEGTWVMGFFRDPDTLQEPIIMGSLPGVPEKLGDPNKGFNDPNRRETNPDLDGYNTSIYPRTTGEPDTNRLARNFEVQDTIVGDKKAKVVEGIRSADGTTYDEPTTTYNAVYPKNHVFESESGHIVEYDDSSGVERVAQHTMPGTFYEVDAAGNRVDKVVSNDYHLVSGNNHEHVQGDMHLTVEGTLNIKCKAFNIEVTDDYTEDVGGSQTIKIEGARTTDINGAVFNVYNDTFDESIHGNIDLRYGAEDNTFSEHIKSDITRNYSAKVEEFLKETYEQNITESSTIRIGTTLDMDITGDVTLDGATVKINQPSGTQNAARKGDTADTGDDPAGISGNPGSDVIETGSGTVFIGDTGATELADPTPAPEVDPNPVSTAETAFGVTGTGMSDTRAREIIKGREDDIAVGLDVDSNEPFEIQSTEQQVITDNDGNEFEDASKSETNIVDDDNNTELTQKNFDGKLLNFLPHTDPRISSQLREIMENVAKEYGRTLTITSAYRSPGYNAKVGGSGKSMHMQGKAVDIRLTNTSIADRQKFMQLLVKHGIKGIGAYFPANDGGYFIHADLGGKRQWGPSGSRRSSYGWQQSTLKPLGYIV